VEKTLEAMAHECRLRRRPVELKGSRPSRTAVQKFVVKPLLLIAFGSLALAAALTGCTSIRSGSPPPPSGALAHPETTALGRSLAPGERAHPGQSGFRVIENGLEALVARAALADAAERTIDVQYYIYEHDEAGSLLTLRLLAAADRGVRVRILLDDYKLGDPRELAALCAHPNISVRIFNPLRWRELWTRFAQYLIDFHRIDRRMHNKLFVVDNTAAILGGRNIGNNYFDLHSSHSIRDFDLLIAGGPTCREASAGFDAFWNSVWAVPADRLVARAPTAADLTGERARLANRVQATSAFERQYAATRAAYIADLGRDPAALIWAPGELIMEPPRKVQEATRQTNLVSEGLDAEWGRTRHEVLVEAAYFVPGAKGVATFRELGARGVRVRLVTCSLDASDVPIVYSGYQKYRRALLTAGVDLYEYKLHPRSTGQDHKWYRLRPLYAALHSKVMIFDRERVWMGSFNLDPRSMSLNTEIAVIIQSRELAAQLGAELVQDMTPGRSWHVTLAGGSTGPLTWTSEEDGRLVTRHREPGGPGERLREFLVSLIPGFDDLL
jgi:putative cardiolipin synthase